MMNSPHLSSAYYIQALLGILNVFFETLKQSQWYS